MCLTSHSAGQWLYIFKISLEGICNGFMTTGDTHLLGCLEIGHMFSTANVDLQMSGQKLNTLCSEQL